MNRVKHQEGFSFAGDTGATLTTAKKLGGSLSHTFEIISTDLDQADGTIEIKRNGVSFTPVAKITMGSGNDTNFINVLDNPAADLDIVYTKGTNSTGSIQVTSTHF